MSRSIDAIWRSKVAQHSKGGVADREFDLAAQQLLQLSDQLDETASAGRWQDHYDAALGVCRLSRRVRFRFVEPERIDPDTKSELVEMLSRALRAIRPDNDASGIKYRVKNLNEIKHNVEYRIERIVEGADEPVFAAD